MMSRRPSPLDDFQSIFLLLPVPLALPPAQQPELLQNLHPLAPQVQLPPQELRRLPLQPPMRS